MSNNFDKIFLETECIEEKILQKYASNELTSPERREVEYHLVECEMCRDELDGLMIIKDSTYLATIIRELNHRIRRLIETKKPKILWLDLRASVSIAAVMLSIIVMTIFLVYHVNISTKEQNIASAEKVNSTQQEMQYAQGNGINKNDSAPSNQLAHNEGNIKSKKDADETQKEKIIESEKLDDATIVNLPQTKQSQDTTKIELISDITIAVESTTKLEMDYKRLNEGITSDDLEDESYDMSKQDQVSKNKKSSRDVVVEETKNLKSIRKQALSLYKKKKFVEAIVQFEEIRNIHSDDDESIYYIGLCNFEQNIFSEATKHFLWFQDKVNSRFYEHAFWYRAQIELKMNNNIQAKILLLKIVSLKGTFASDAEKLLKKIR